MSEKNEMNFEGGGLPSNTLNSSVLGEVVWLMAQSDLHKEWPLGSILQWVIPALLNNQYRLYRQGEKPIGYVSWALLSEEKEKQYALNPSSLEPKDWQSGDRLWLLDWVAPYGGTYAIAKDLKNNLFPNQVGRALRWKKDRDTMNIFYLHGKKALDLARDHVANPTVDLGAAID